MAWFQKRSQMFPVFPVANLSSSIAALLESHYVAAGQTIPFWWLNMVCTVLQNFLQHCATLLSQQNGMVCLVLTILFLPTSRWGEMVAISRAPPCGLGTCGLSFLLQHSVQRSSQSVECVMGVGIRAKNCEVLVGRNGEREAVWERQERS